MIKHIENTILWILEEMAYKKKKEKQKKKKKAGWLALILLLLFGAPAFADYYLPDGTLVQWQGGNTLKIGNNYVQGTRDPVTDRLIPPDTSISGSGISSSQLSSSLPSQSAGGDSTFSYNSGISVPVFNNGSFSGYSNLWQNQPNNTADPLGKTYYGNGSWTNTSGNATWTGWSVNFNSGGTSSSGYSVGGYSGGGYTYSPPPPPPIVIQSTIMVSHILYPGKNQTFPTTSLPVRVLAGGVVEFEVTTTGGAQTVNVTFSDGKTQNLQAKNSTSNDSNTWVGYYYPAGDKTIPLNTPVGTQISITTCKASAPGKADATISTSLLIVDGSADPAANGQKGVRITN